VVTAPAAACSGTDDVVESNPRDPSKGDVDAGGVERADARWGDPPDVEGKQDGGKDSSSADAQNPDASTLYTSDPLNCGAKSHDCLGGTCTQGICAKQQVRARATWLTIDGDGSLVTLVETGSTDTVRRGAPSPNAVDTALFTTPHLGTYTAKFFMANVLTHVNPTNPVSVQQWKGAGGQAGGAVTLPATGPTDVAVDASHVFFVEASHLYRVDYGGANKTSLAPATSFVSRDLAVDGTDIYVLSHSDPPYVRIDRVPASAGGVTNIPFTDVAILGADELEATPTHLVVMGYRKEAGKSAESAIWTVPKGGGTSTVLATWNGLADHMLVSGDYVYWTQRPSSASLGHVTIQRRRVDGSDAIVTILEDSPTAYIDSLAVDGSYLYWASYAAWRAPK
jgi:hypothetical protein